MTVDESSSQDATLIDDDLVAALGFEPLTPRVASNGHGEDSDESVDSASGDTLVEAAVDDDITVADSVIDDIAVVDDLVVDDSVVDAAVDAEIDGVDLRQDLGAVDGFGVDEVVPDTAANDSVDQLIVDDAVVDSGAAADGDNFFDEVTDDAVDTDEVVDSGAAVDTDNFFDDEADEATDEATDDVVVDSEIVADVESDEAEPSSDSFFDLDEDATDDGATDDGATDDGALDDGGAAEPMAAELDGAASGAAVIDIDLDEPSTAVIDLDLDPISDRLADADDVFAEVAVGDVDVHPSIESLDLVGLEDGTVVGELAVGEAFADETLEAAALATATPNKRRRRLRARKSRRVIRHIDPWSVLTFSVLFHMCVFAAMLLSSVLVWNAATASGMVENIESFIQELGDYETFEINADVMFKAAVVIAGMLTLASSVMVVLLTVVFNLISDLVGGIRVTVIEEETVRVPVDKKWSKAAVE